MIPFKKILAPTDFSDASYEAMKSANELARHFDAVLYVIHVVPLVPVTPSSMDPEVFNVPLYQQGLQVSYNELLQKAVNKWVSRETKVQHEVLHGNAANEIIRMADEEDMDLIVIATHGESGLGHFIFGSVTEKVVRMALCPVLTLRVKEEEK